MAVSYSFSAPGELVVSAVNAAKDQIDPRGAGAGFLFNPMFPTVLGVAFHQKQAARGEF